MEDISGKNSRDEVQNRKRESKLDRKIMDWMVGMEDSEK